jgi:hypothetical protein
VRVRHQRRSNREREERERQTKTGIWILRWFGRDGSFACWFWHVSGELVTTASKLYGFPKCSARLVFFISKL